MITMEALQEAIKQRIDAYNNEDFPRATRTVNTVALLDSCN